MRTKIISLLLITSVMVCIGCSCSSAPSQTDKNTCIQTCDKSLISCVQTLGPDHKMDCHKTYDTVCMPGCSKTKD